MRRLFCAITLLLYAALLTACGQAGPLYLPTPQTDKTRAHDTFILKGSKKPTSTAQTKQS